MVKVFIDPGHGGTDPGAVGNGLQEKNLTLQIATRIKDILTLEYDNVSILMSRTGDQTVSLSERTKPMYGELISIYLSTLTQAGELDMKIMFIQE